MPRPRKQYEISPTLAADVMTCIAINPPATTISDITEDIGNRDRVTINRAALMLTDRNWVQKIGTQQPAMGRPTNLLAATPEFWQAYEDTLEVTRALPDPDALLFSEAVTHRSLAERLPSPSSELDHALSTFIGHTAILGGRQNLADSADWMTGTAGWRTLVTLRAEARGANPL